MGIALENGVYMGAEHWHGKEFAMIGVYTPSFI
jgi:hypothetical protein